MKKTKTSWLLLMLSLAVGSVPLATPAIAGQFLIDFAGTGPNSSGAAAGWDAIDNLVQDVATPPLTDLNGTDTDVTITALDDGFNPNNTAPPNSGDTHDGIAVPQEARNDYLFKIADTAGTTARMRFDNLDAGQYNITVFEGRTSDTGQFAKIWVGDDTGSGEPATENTGSFAPSGSATVAVEIEAGDVLWYRHLEDGSGGISGMIINPVAGVIEVIAAADFDGRTLTTTTTNNDTAASLNWTTNGVDDPGELTAVPDVARNNGFGQFEANGLFTTAAAADAFVPNLNIHNEGTYYVDVPLSTVAQVRVDIVSLTAQIHNNAGVLQGVGREVDLSVAILDAGDNVIAEDSLSGQNAIGHNMPPAPVGIEFDLGGAILASGATYRLRISVGADANLVGNNAGFDDLVISGAIGSGTGFAITSIKHDPANNSATISWSSISGRVYAIDFSTDLALWLELDDSFIADGEISQFTEPDLPEGTTRRFYRVRLAE